MPERVIKRVCWSVDEQKLEAFKGACDKSGLPYSRVVEELMDYFVRLESAAATIPEEQAEEQGGGS